MMSFLDLSAASEEERRLIREILSDTSVVNFAVEPSTKQTSANSSSSSLSTTNTTSATSTKSSSKNNSNNCNNNNNNLKTVNQTTTTPTSTTKRTNTSASSAPPTSTIYQPHHDSLQPNLHHHPHHPQLNLHHHQQHHHPHHHHHHHHQQQQQLTIIQSALIPTAVASDTTALPTTTTTNNNNNLTGSQSVPASAAQLQLQQQQQPPLASDINSRISMDMTATTQPQGYATLPPPHVTAFAPPPPHVYGGTPIFQQPYPYFIPYASMSPYVPYVLPNNVVPARHQAPPLSNQQQQPPNATNSHSRSHSHHHSTHNHQIHPQQHHHQSQQAHSKSEPNAIANGRNNTTSNNTSSINNLNRHSQLHQQHQSPNIKGDSPNVATTTARPSDSSSADLSRRIEQTSSQKVKIFNTSEKEPSIEMAQNGSTHHPNANQKEAKFVQQSISEKIRMVQDTDETVQEEKNLISEPTQISSGLLNSDHDLNSPAKIIKEFENITMPKNGSIQAAENNKNLVPNNNINNIQARDQAASQIIELSNVNYTSADRRNCQTSSTRPSNQAKIRASTGPSRTDEPVKDKGFETQTSSLDVSKHSHELSYRPTEESKAISEQSNQTVHEKSHVEVESNSTEGNNQKNGLAWCSAASKSWASLFKRDGNRLIASNINGDIDQTNHPNFEDSDEEQKLVAKSDGANTNLTTPSKELRSQEAAKRALDKTASRLAQKINSINLKHALPFLRPRGFINKGNGCYINSTLQALIACPPFYNLMREISEVRGFRRENSCTPILDGFAELFLNFPPIDASKKNKQANSQDQKLQLSSLQAEAIEPKCIYNVLGQIKSECLKGAQEDAEEFLSSVLNGLHEEMISLSETLQESATQNGHSSDVEDINDDLASDDNLWREVGPRNRSLPIRTARVVNTPIQEIFGGSLFSIRTAGKDRCGHRSPFFDLQLDISGDHVRNVNDAIKSFTAPETIHDFYCSKTKQKLDAQRRTSLDQLPPILILHLKQFVYTHDHGLKKLMKKVDYPIDFELPESCLHEKNSNDKNRKNSTSYKLLAVVYHDGKEAVKGHYLTDVYHIGSGQWLRCDDGNLKVIASPRVESQDSFRTPYLLFYRRFNTLRAQTGNHDNKRKS